MVATVPVSPLPSPDRALENIPVLSYLWQRGRCRHCQERISLQYPLVEILSGMLAALTAWHFGYGWQALAALVLTWGLLALSVIDLQRQLLPDSITLPLLWLGIGLALFGLFTDLRSSVIGVMAGYLSLWSVYWLFRLLTGKEGMGQGISSCWPCWGPGRAGSICLPSLSAPPVWARCWASF